LKILHTAIYSSSISAITFLAGCSVGSGVHFAPLATGAIASRATTHSVPPNCCAHTKTLFISNALNGTVQMFRFPSNKYIGQVAAPPEGFGLPEGMCNDDKGDVYIANSGEYTIDEYSHDGTFVRALPEPGESSISCAFDRSTGDLAVSNETNVENGPGSVTVYKKATGSPTTYTSSEFAHIYFLDYMGKTGVLYFDGTNNSNQFVYGSLRKGKIKLIPIIGETIKYGGTVAYSAKTHSMNVGDQLAEVLYQVSATGRITGSTPLPGSKDVLVGTIQGGRFVAPDAEGDIVRIYAYPEGGDPQSTITKHLTGSAGSAVSPADDSDRS
jgi:hypothetical protein